MGKVSTVRCLEEDSCQGFVKCMFFLRNVLEEVRNISDNDALEGMLHDSLILKPPFKFCFLVFICQCLVGYERLVTVWLTIFQRKNFICKAAPSFCCSPRSSFDYSYKEIIHLGE